MKQKRIAPPNAATSEQGREKVTRPNNQYTTGKGAA